MDYLVLIAIRTFFFAINLLPLSWRIALVSGIIRIVLLFKPKYYRIARINIKQVFPESDEIFAENLIKRHIESLARLIVDCARLGSMTEAWIREHVTMSPLLNKLIEERAKPGAKGVLATTGHLSSFEILAKALVCSGYPLNIVVRDFNLPAVDRWWQKMREANGNKVMSRDGAIKGILREVQSGGVAAILFDQNVTRKNAIFVDWFGRPAATTIAVPFAVLRGDALVYLFAISYVGNDKYNVTIAECDLSDIKANDALSPEEKAKQVTQRVSSEYQKLILQNPHEWFWFHRRWKTAPTDEAEGFYRT